uniref:protein HEG n=1 Tax=Pristiophorus japonicus TaxID=55135 RepID=UPI00398E5BF9
MAMKRSVTSSCLLLLICYTAAATAGSTSTAGTLATEMSVVSSTSIAVSVTDSTTTSSNSTTSVGLLTSPTTKLSFTSNEDLSSGSTNSTSSSGLEGTSMLITNLVPNTSLSTSIPPMSTSNETSSLTEKNVSTTEMQTSLSNASAVTTSSPVNKTGTISSAPTAQMVTTTEMPTNATVNVTQTSTVQHTTIAATLNNNASTSMPAPSGDTNITVSTAVSTNETSTVVTSNITLTSTSATTEANTNVTMLVTVPVNVTMPTTVTMLVNITMPTTDTIPMNVTMPTTDAMPTNGTSGMMSRSTEVFNSSWSTAQPPKTSTTRPGDHCANAICPPGSKCVNLFLSFACQCPLGFHNQGNNCVPVRSFPGVLHLKNVIFMYGMNEINSQVFFDTANEIEKEVKGFFKNDRFHYQSVVRKLEKGSVNAFIDNIFALSSNATEESVIASIKNGIKNCDTCKLVSDLDSYHGESLCSPNYCDMSTSRCKANNGIATCNCLPGYYKFAASDRSCKACPTGFKLENGACVKCPFGYGGFNCGKSYLLAVVVISCVLGGLLLLLLLALITVCLRTRSGKCSSSSSSHDYVMWPKSELPKIPRATMHWDGNQLEMQENGSTSSLTDIHRDGGRTPEKNDDLKTFKGKQPSRYTYLCQGQENPYYVSDEKKPEYL